MLSASAAESLKEPNPSCNGTGPPSERCITTVRLSVHFSAARTKAERGRRQDENAGEQRQETPMSREFYRANTEKITFAAGSAQVGAGIGGRIPRLWRRQHARQATARFIRRTRGKSRRTVGSDREAAGRGCVGKGSVWQRASSPMPRSQQAWRHSGRAARSSPAPRQRCRRCHPTRRRSSPGRRGRGARDTVRGTTPRPPRRARRNRSDHMLRASLRSCLRMPAGPTLALPGPATSDRALLTGSRYRT